MLGSFTVFFNNIDVSTSTSPKLEKKNLILSINWLYKNIFFFNSIFKIYNLLILEIYCDNFVLILTISSFFIKNGTFIIAPVSNSANLLPFKESFFVSGDVFITFKLTKFGGVIKITLNVYQRII